ncbi:MAG: HEAT repeat domain-containing protein [Halobacteriota archaeon]|jgi:HEAT repeat protein
MKRTILIQHSKDAAKREEVVRELGTRGDPSALDALSAALMDEDCRVCWRAADAIGGL